MIQNYLVQTNHCPVQVELFPDDTCLSSPPAGITYIPDLLADHQSLFQWLQATTRWHIRYMTRETITWGESHTPGKKIRTRYPWPECIEPLTWAIRDRIGYLPNQCIANHYPSGKHSIGFHSDHMESMENRTGVTILSLGARRHMVLRRKDVPTIRYHYALDPGSGFHMDDASQSDWQHGVLPEPACGPRISLSFRRLIERDPIHSDLWKA